MHRRIFYTSTVMGLLLFIQPAFIYGERLALDLSPGVPHDFNLAKTTNDPLAVEKDAFNIATYAWNTFFALNFPSYPIDSGKRGQPDPDQAINFGLNGPTVWNTFKQKRELFRTIVDPTSPTGFLYDTSDPGDFESLIAFEKMSPNIAPCAGVTPVSPNEVWNFLDEAQEISLASIWANDFSPTADNLVYTQVKMNKAYYDYVRQNRLYSTVALNRMIARQNPTTDFFGGVHLPEGNKDNEGAILIKSSWVKNAMLPQTLQYQYYSVNGMYFDVENSGTPSQKICYRTDKFSLIGIHMIHKTESFPEFLYTSFDNIHNPDAAFFYANANGTASTLPNAFGVPYTHPANPQPGLQDPPYPVQYELNPRRPVVEQLNREAQSLIASVYPNAVWQNYQLVGLQFTPANGPKDFANQSQDYYLANPVIETNQRFQKFTGTFTASNQTNVLPHPYGQTSAVQMGGCQGCHGAGGQGGAFTQAEILQGRGGTDFSFILFRARQNPTDQGVETIKDALDQITPGVKYPVQPWFSLKPPVGFGWRLLGY